MMKMSCFLIILVLFGMSCFAQTHELSTDVPIFPSHVKNALRQLQEVETLWTNDIAAASDRIGGFKTNISHETFGNALFCSNYVRFVEGLRPEAIPVKYGIVYLGKCFRSLIGVMDQSCREYPQNREFHLMLEACLLNVYRREQGYIDGLIEAKSPLPPSPGRRVADNVLCLKKSERTAYDEWHKRRQELAELNFNRRRLKEEIDFLQLEDQFDDEKGMICQWIEAIPEPRRTRLIDYIEKRIGRRMKWR